MRNISKACGIALGTVYNYYPTKKELVIDMMLDHWQEFFYRIEDVADSDFTLYEKLYRIFTELNSFIKTFKALWLKPEFYDNPDYVESGIEKETNYIERLIVFVESILLKEIEANKVKTRLDSYEAAKFIVMNFITMIQMPIFKYSSFEVILKQLIY